LIIFDWRIGNTCLQGDTKGALTHEQFAALLWTKFPATVTAAVLALATCAL